MVWFTKILDVEIIVFERYSVPSNQLEVCRNEQSFAKKYKSTLTKEILWVVDRINIIIHGMSSLD